ncbi:hypothetical protein [uncultured Mediterranean phage uvMED]|nr:hypothetical protein [uncultured Mediterranean phage uvMED]
MAIINFVITANGAGYVETDGNNPIASTEATAVIKNDIVSIVLSDGSSWKNSHLEFCTLNGAPLDSDPRVAIDQLAIAGFRTPSGGSGGGDTITGNQLNYLGDELTSVITTNQGVFTSNTVVLQNNVFSSGYSTWASQVTSNINVPNGQERNLIDDILPSSAISSIFPVELIEDPTGNFLRLDYLGTNENLTVDLGFGGRQTGTDFIRIEIRRLDGSTVERSRTNLPINSRDSPFGKVVMPTLTIGTSDPYYTEGFRIFLINTTGGGFSIPARISFQDIDEDNFFRLYITRIFTKTITTTS